MNRLADQTAHVNLASKPYTVSIIEKNEALERSVGVYLSGGIVRSALNEDNLDVFSENREDLDTCLSSVLPSG